MSPGWQESASQMASSVEKRTARAFREHADQQEYQQHGKPAVDRKAGVQAAWMRGRRDALDDRLQAVGARSDERVAGANRLDHRQQALEDDPGHRHHGEPD